MLARLLELARSSLRRDRSPAGPADFPLQPAPLSGLLTATSVGRGLQRAIRGRVLTPGEPDFKTAAHAFNPLFDDRAPLAVARPLDARDVRDAIRFTAPHGVRVRARSGGHSYGGYSTVSDGVVIDLRRLRSIAFDKRSGTATIGAGSQLIDIAATLAGKGVTVPAGSCPSVGVAGVTLGGGFGLAGRHLGLTLDSLIAVRIVTADGQLRSVDAQSDPELFWALRGGGGGNFGIVTDFVFKVHPIPRSACYFSVAWPWSEANDAIAAWQSWAPHAPDTVTSILHLNAGVKPSITANGQFIGSSPAVPSLLRHLLEVPGARLESNHEMPYLALQLLLAGCADIGAKACHTAGTSDGGTLPRETFRAKSDYVAKPLPHSGRAAMVAAAEHPGSGALLCDAYGGAIAHVAKDATAFVHREELFCIQYYGAGPSLTWVDQAAAKMRPFVSGRAYQNYIDPELEHWQDAYYGENRAKLEATRRHVDPDHYFDFAQAIGRS